MNTQEVVKPGLIDLELAERTALYSQSNLCEKCTQPIRSVGDALLVHRADGNAYLIHFANDCYTREVDAMLIAYLSEPRPRRPLNGSCA